MKAGGSSETLVMSYKLHSVTSPKMSQGLLDKQNSNLSVAFNDVHKQIKRTLWAYKLHSTHTVWLW
jgi:hypothetical protein